MAEANIGVRSGIRKRGGETSTAFSQEGKTPVSDRPAPTEEVPQSRRVTRSSRGAEEGATPRRQPEAGRGRPGRTPSRLWGGGEGGGEELPRETRRPPGVAEVPLAEAQEAEVPAAEAPQAAEAPMDGEAAGDLEEEEDLDQETMDSEEEDDPLAAAELLAEGRRRNEAEVGGIHKGRVKPESFDGSQDWEDYLHHFRLVAVANSWSEKEKAVQLGVCLRGPARTTMRNARIKVDEKGAYRQLIKALGDRFQSPDQVDLFKQQLKTYRQKSGEGLSELADEIERLVCRA